MNVHAYFLVMNHVRCSRGTHIAASYHFKCVIQGLTNSVGKRLECRFFFTCGDIARSTVSLATIAICLE